MSPLALNFSTRVKIYLILLATFIVFLIAFYSGQNILHKKYEYLNILQKKQLTENIVLLNTTYLKKWAINYACSDWMVHFVSFPVTPQTLENKIPVETLGFSLVLIYNIQLKPIYSDYIKPLTDSIIIPSEMFSILLKKKQIDFFLNTKYGLVQLVGSAIHPSSEINGKIQPSGFFIIGKLWDNKFLAELEKLTGNRYKLINNLKDSAVKIPEMGYISLKSYNNNIASYLQVTSRNRHIDQNRNKNLFYTFFVIAILLLLIITITALEVMLLRPLGKIVSTLNSASPEKLIATAIRRDEFGKISRYLLEFYSQKKVLQNKLFDINFAQDDLQRLNNELQMQKEELLTSSNKLLKANEEITESIKYASIIQDAVLNAPSSFYSAFPEHFIIYKPKNILSGDFYWIQEKDNRFYIACADCTGHGLAGSLLSMLGISFLKDIMHQQNNLKAAEIINYLREFIVETLNQTGEFGEAHGGMDIVFCIIDPAASKLEYASAFNSFYIVSDKNESSENQLVEYKGDPMPVGIYIKNEAFTNHIIDINDGDMIYLFSDGFIDQFGGPDNKKYRSNNFKKLIFEASKEPYCGQKKILEDTFKKWQGENEQTDDILVMGIRYKLRSR
jgi:serine phosphatase RsbU (regulator of sigma subunit)/sensor domain CHASE-containing protein